MIPANGPTRVEFFIGGMVIDPNGTILRLDISDGFAEITQNGTMNRNANSLVHGWQSGFVIRMGDQNMSFPFFDDWISVNYKKSGSRVLGKN
ncbi:MAG: hypothetical protein IPN95_31730 [Bacteroidetes bacterium]|nr:hypothetical protein [Bacteroidota bacterium]